MRVYISIPISGKDYDEQKARAEKIKEELYREGHEGITPFDVVQVPDAPYCYAMGKDIEVLLACDAAVFAEGWNESKGCRLERQACLIYGIKIL